MQGIGGTNHPPPSYIHIALSCYQTHIMPMYSGMQCFVVVLAQLVFTVSTVFILRYSNTTGIWVLPPIEYTSSANGGGNPWIVVRTNKIPYIETFPYTLYVFCFVLGCPPSCYFFLMFLFMRVPLYRTMCTNCA